MTAVKEEYVDCSFVSIHYIICECGQTFPSNKVLREHLEKEHPDKRERKEFKCGLCGSIYDTEEECINHYEEQHFNDSDIKEEDEALPDLQDEAQNKLEITYDYDDLSNQPEDQYQQEYKIKFNPLDYDEHLQEISQEVIKQEDMSQDVTSQDAVSQAETAQATQILAKANGDRQYPEVRAPPLKMVRDADTGQLVLVFNRTRPAKTRSKLHNTPKTTKDIICEVCGKKYASNAALKYHQRVHTGEKPYHCHLCPKAFTMPLFLQIHVRTHTGERPFQCPMCPKAFSNKAALLRHERVHTGVKPYSCPMCLKAFTQSNSMKLHVATVHLKQPAPYKSRTRRMKEAARGLKSSSKIKAFAPNTSEEPGDSQSDGEYEVVISEEVQDPDNTCYEVVYEEDYRDDE